jgi:hypothetical protein
MLMPAPPRELNCSMNTHPPYCRVLVSTPPDGESGWFQGWVSNVPTQKSNVCSLRQGYRTSSALARIAANSAVARSEANAGSLSTIDAGKPNADARRRCRSASVSSCKWAYEIASRNHAPPRDESVVTMA